MDSKRIRMQDGVRLYLHAWDEVKSPIGVIQIFHGLAEHIGRYQEFAAFFNKLGFIVAGADRRIHGMTSNDSSSVGHRFQDVYREDVSDQLAISDELRRRYGLPITLLGHSFGSFLVQSYLLENPVPDDIKNVILTGATKLSPSQLFWGALSAGVGKRRSPATLIRRATFMTYDKYFAEGTNRWLTRDEAVCEAYNNDPLVKFGYSKGMYRSFFRGVKNLYANASTNRVGNIPVLILGGGNDAFGDFGRGLIALSHWLERRGFRPIEVRIYPGARHEILNETNRKAIFEDIAHYFKGL